MLFLSMKEGGLWDVAVAVVPLSTVEANMKEVWGVFVSSQCPCFGSKFRIFCA